MTAVVLSAPGHRTDTEDQASECGRAKLRDDRGGRRRAYHEEAIELSQAWTDSLLTFRSFIRVLYSWGRYKDMRGVCEVSHGEDIGRSR